MTYLNGMKEEEINLNYMFEISWNYYWYFTWFWIFSGIITFIYLLKVTAPYGRHTSSSWGPMVNNNFGWFIMEFFVLTVLYFFLITGINQITLTTWILVGFFTFHYVNRSIIFPFRLRTNGKKMPVVIMFSGMLFNLVNGFLFGYYLSHFKSYDLNWLQDIRFILGALIFLVGMGINWIADTKLINLRKPGETGYKIPKGWLFEKVSCPNLLGEIIEWAGFAIMTWSLPGVAFFVWTFANLVPRALSHHKWYKNKFPDYPVNRKAVFPHIL